MFAVHGDNIRLAILARNNEAHSGGLLLNNNRPRQGNGFSTRHGVVYETITRLETRCGHLGILINVNSVL